MHGACDEALYKSWPPGNYPALRSTVGRTSWSQARSLRVFRKPPIQLMKILEQLPDLVWSDADSGIFHFDPQACILFEVRSDRDTAALGCKFQSVGYVVEKHLLESLRVDFDHDFSRPDITHK